MGTWLHPLDRYTAAPVRTPQVDPQAPDAAGRRSFIQSVVDRFPKDLVANNPAIGPNAHSANVSRINQNRDVTGRVDWNASDKDMFYTRYQYGDVLIRTAEIVRGIYSAKPSLTKMRGSPGRTCTRRAPLANFVLVLAAAA